MTHGLSRCEMAHLPLLTEFSRGGSGATASYIHRCTLDGESFILIHRKRRDLVTMHTGWR